MAEHRPGPLAGAKEGIEEHRENAVSAGNFLEPDWFESELLYREVESMIDPKGPSS